MKKLLALVKIARPSISSEHDTNRMRFSVEQRSVRSAWIRRTKKADRSRFDHLL